VLRGTTATPYGLTSPFFGTVDAMTRVWDSGPMNVDEAFAAVATMPAPASRPVVAVTTTAILAADLRVDLMSDGSLRLASLRREYGPWTERDWPF
jgi:hypothetical protein